MEKTYRKGYPTHGLVSFLDEMKKFGFEFLTKIVVFTKFKKVTLFCEDLYCDISCEIGVNGVVDHINSRTGDGKTPICSTKVRHIDLPTEDINNPDSAVFSKTLSLPVNFGPCYISLYITDPQTNEIRGIGFHGSKDDRNGLLATNGCIRILNADLYLIRKLFYKNLKVYIR